MIQYLRAADVTVGKSKTLGTTFKGLRVAFDVEKNAKSEPNDARVTIYNLSDKSRAALEDPELIVRLDVGYAGFGETPVMSQLFIGDIRYVTSRRQGPDYVTTIEAGDAEKQIREATLDRSFPAQTTMDTVIKAITSSLGVAVGTITPALGKVFENGFVVSGSAAKYLDDLTKNAGMVWHITDGELNILPEDGTTNEPSIVVSPTTGLIGSPSKRRPDKKSKAQGDLTGYEFEMLINAGLKPGRIVFLNSSIVTGVMRVERVRFHGDTHFGDWVARVEAS